MTTQEETEALAAVNRLHVIAGRTALWGDRDDITNAANVIERLLSSSKAARELREALVSIRTECDPGFLPFKDPEDGRARLFAIADAALTAK